MIVELRERGRRAHARVGRRAEQLVKGRVGDAQPRGEACRWAGVRQRHPRELGVRQPELDDGGMIVTSREVVLKLSVGREEQCALDVVEPDREGARRL